MRHKLASASAVFALTLAIGAQANADTADAELHDTNDKAVGSVTLSEVRDMFHSSRKYAQALLEHLDEVGVTKRLGDRRVLR